MNAARWKTRGTGWWEGGRRVRGCMEGGALEKEKREGEGEEFIRPRENTPEGCWREDLIQDVSRNHSNRVKMLLWSQVTFLLLLCLMELVRTTSVSPSLLRAPLTRVRFIEVEDDYDDVSSKTTITPHAPGVTTSRVTSRLCDYDPCVVQTTPCEKISAQTGCLCPGLKGPDEIPGAPELREVKLGGSGEVTVYWCSPLSTVTRYEVTLNDGNEQMIFGENIRNGAIPENRLKIGETVCVAARNEAGLSEKSCARYEPPQPHQSALSAGIIAGSVGFLLLLSVFAVVLWKLRTCRKGGMGEAEGLGNPSYTSDGAL